MSLLVTFVRVVDCRSRRVQQPDCDVVPSRSDQRLAAMLQVQSRPGGKRGIADALGATTGELQEDERERASPGGVIRPEAKSLERFV